ncbi:MAG: molybdenum cofactor biosynthesis protein MoaE [Acidobacteriota bacterium]|nr:molybdenum cofactor biosynthesis protein MoaE [Acidobacteriota bacterium]
MRGNSGILLSVQVRVLFFGMLKDIAGGGEQRLTLADGARLADALAECEQQWPKLTDYLAATAVAINQEFAPVESRLKDGDEIALLPPVSGGAPPKAPPGEPLVRMQRERIVPHDIVPKLERPEDGAVVIFDGIVRNHSRGRETKYLEYDAYEPMALKQLEQLAAEARQKFAIRNVAIVHRLGKLEIGESSVLIVVFSAHRAAAFEACRWLIDTLKQTVPIWKKEFFADGAVWAPGEAFPEAIPTAGKGAK